MGACGGTKEKLTLNAITTKLTGKNDEYLADLQK